MYGVKHTSILLCVYLLVDFFCVKLPPGGYTTTAEHYFAFTKWRFLLLEQLQYHNKVITYIAHNSLVILQFKETRLSVAI